MFKYIFAILVFLNSSFAMAGKYKISQPGKADVYVPTLESDGKSLEINGNLKFSVTKLSNEQATSLGLKQYIAGNTYNGNNTISLGGTDSFSFTRAVFVPYQMQDGTWRLKFNVRGTRSAGAAGWISISGVIFKDASGWQQSIDASQNDANSISKSYAFTSQNSNEISYSFTAPVTIILFSGDVELKTKPIWAY